MRSKRELKYQMIVLMTDFVKGKKSSFRGKYKSLTLGLMVVQVGR